MRFSCNTFFMPVLACLLATGFATPSVATAQQSVPYPIQQPLTRPHPRLAPEADIDGGVGNKAELLSSMDTVLATLGRGMNTFQGRIAGDCVNGFVVGPKPTSFAPSYSIQVIQSYEQFQKETSVEASLSGSFSIFSASVRSRFQQSNSSTSTAQFLLVRERVVAKPEINLKKANMHVSLPTSGDANSQRLFYQRCGDQFISQIQMGAEFIAVLDFQQTEAEKKQSLEANATASGWGAVAAVDFNSKMNDLKKESNLQITANQSGGRATSLPEFTLDGFIAYTRNFPAQVDATTVVPVGFRTESYIDLGADEPDFSNTTQNFQSARENAFRAARRIQMDLNLQGALNHWSIPGQRYQNDIVDRTSSDLASARAFYREALHAVDQCANSFWIPKECTFTPAMLDYHPAPVSPFIVRKVDTRSPAPTDVAVPNDNMRLELRGEYCWRGDNICDHNGVNPRGDGRDAYVSFTTPNIGPGPHAGVYTGALTVNKGLATVRAVDTDYRDNGGDLYVLVY